jgi:hypothetical protein
VKEGAEKAREELEKARREFEERLGDDTSDRCVLLSWRERVILEIYIYNGYIFASLRRGGSHFWGKIK